MSQPPAAIFKIPTESPQPVQRKVAKPPARPKKSSAVPRSHVLASGNGRAATRGGGEVIELECGITVYRARSEGGRWRAVWYESDERQQCEALRLPAVEGEVSIEAGDSTHVNGHRQSNANAYVSVPPTRSC